MQVTIVQTSDDNARVHKAGCADLTRRELRRRDYISHYTVEVSTRAEAVADAWSDFLAEESMTQAEADGYTEFLPCCDSLPVA
jgi:hypothetical protein